MSEVLALQAEGLSHNYGDVRALNNVSLRIPQGGFLALVGPNGAGKTTLFNLLSGLFHPQHGSIAVAGQNLARRPRHALAALGVVFQRRALDADLTVRQNLTYHASLHGFDRARAKKRAQEEAQRMDIADKMDRRAGSLSGGEARRLEIARALLHRPKLLLLDEPTTGLDAPSRAGVLRHLRALAASRECATLFATHLFDEINENDDTVFLHRGGAVANGKFGGLLREHKCEDAGALFTKLTSEG